MINIKNIINIFNVTVSRPKINFHKKNKINICYERYSDGYSFWAVNNAKENISVAFSGIRPKQSLYDVFHDKEIIRSKYNPFMYYKTEFELLVQGQTSERVKIPKEVIRSLGKRRKEFLLEVSFKDENNRSWNRTIVVRNYFNCLAERF